MQIVWRSATSQERRFQEIPTPRLMCDCNDMICQQRTGEHRIGSEIHMGNNRFSTDGELLCRPITTPPSNTLTVYSKLCEGQVVRRRNRSYDRLQQEITRMWVNHTWLQRWGTRRVQNTGTIPTCSRRNQNSIIDITFSTWVHVSSWKVYTDKETTSTSTSTLWNEKCT